jgi:hypothetical protein
MDLVGLITPINFKGERYYISFTNNYIRFTIVYTIYKKISGLVLYKGTITKSILNLILKSLKFILIIE